MRVGVGAGLVAALVNGFCLKWAEYMLVLQSRQRLAWLGRYCQVNSIESNATVLAAYSLPCRDHQPCVGIVRLIGAAYYTDAHFCFSLSLSSLPCRNH